MNIPEWAKDIRMSKAGIIFKLHYGKWDGGSKYLAGPYTIRFGYNREWFGSFQGPGSDIKSLFPGQGLLVKARWFATLHFFGKLAEVDGLDVKPFLNAKSHRDWTAIRVMADFLGDHDRPEEDLVRHFIPKRA